MSQLWKDDDGQAVIEYLLMVAFTVAIVSTMAIGFRKIVFKIWEDITQKTVGGSPLNPSNSQYRFR